MTRNVLKKLNTIAKVCPSNENYYYKGHDTYEYLHYSTEVEFTPYNIISIKDYRRNDWNENDCYEVKVYFESDRAYKRCKKLYEEWYYNKLPFYKD